MTTSPQWDAIHREIQLTAELLEDELSTSQLNALLAQRAKQFATDVQSLSNFQQRYFLKFTVGNEIYGIDVQTVQTIVTLQRLTPVAGAPPHYVGITNVKGQILSALSLPIFFGLSSSVDLAKTSFVIAVQLNDMRLGILADMVHEVLTISAEQVSTHTSDDPSFIVSLPDGTSLLDLMSIANDLKGQSEEHSK